MQWIALLFFSAVASAQDCPPPLHPELLPVWETVPELIGGIEALQVSVAHPGAGRPGDRPQVIVGFIVETDGVPSNLTVLRGIRPAVDSAAVAAVRQARFTPGTTRCIPTRFRMTLPVAFRFDAVEPLQPRPTRSLRASAPRRAEKTP